MFGMGMRLCFDHGNESMFGMGMRLCFDHGNEFANIVLQCLHLTTCCCSFTRMFTK